MKLYKTIKTYIAPTSREDFQLDAISDGETSYCESYIKRCIDKVKDGTIVKIKPKMEDFNPLELLNGI